MSRGNHSNIDKSYESDTEEQTKSTSQQTSENKNKPKSSKRRNSRARARLNFFSSQPIPVLGTDRIVPIYPVIPATMIPVTTVAPYFPQQYVGQSVSYTNEYAVAPIPLPGPAYNMPYPTVPIVLPPQMMPPVGPYSSPIMTRPILGPVVPQPVIVEEYPAPSIPIYDMSPFSPEQTVPVTVDYQTMEDFGQVETEATFYDAAETVRQRDPLGAYLALPKHLFPTARMLALDPNPMIDEFCRIPDIFNHSPWILDLEFGVPRVPITRPIATYDVKYNSIHCKNTPSAIHPGFESCSQQFKRVLLFYYDCVISTWYRGYVQINSNSSVEDFQTWMLPPMQVFGMCWP